MNRLIAHIQATQKMHKKIFTAFLTLGYPNLKMTETLIVNFEKIGVDIIEIGFPFSDPMADGPTIQFSSQKALESGVQLKDAFGMAARLRKRGIKVPLLFFTYLNPVFHYGYQKFVNKAIESGFDALLIPDLPPEEDRELSKHCKRKGLAQVYLMAPTTDRARARAINAVSSGFIYYVSVKGVTGARKSLPSVMKAHLKILKRQASKPLLIGFGVSGPKQAQKLSRFSEGVIVGSAIIERLKKNPRDPGPVVSFVRNMVRSVKNVSS